MSDGVTFRTERDLEHPDLRGRTFAIPFDRVWSSALDVVEGLRGWTLTGSDDQVGWVTAQVESWPLRRTAVITITIGLDENGQTRVDVASTPESGTGGVGVARRRTRRFFQKLDARVGANAANTLDVRTREAS